MTTVDLSSERVDLGGAGRTVMIAGLVLAAIGLGAAVAGGMMGDEAAQKHFYHAYLTNFAFYLSLALGGLFFVLMAHLTRAGWSVTVRRIGEAVAANVGVMALLALVILVAGMGFLYPWTDHSVHDPLNEHKAPYLNESFFWVRMIAYFVVWGFLAWFFLSNSRRQDLSGDPRLTRRMEVVSAPGTILFALTVTFASFDLLMSLYPHWFSTIFGVYYFAGAFVGFISFFILLLMVLQRMGVLRRVVNREHYHDLGKLLFAFVVFWAYIAFSQFMLIWYGNLPEETIWYEYRAHGGWMTVSMILLFGHFLLPFLFMISRHPKRQRFTLALSAIWMLGMHWVDMYWLVMPTAYHDEVPFGWLEVATFVGMGGLFVAVLMWRLGRQSLVPVRDPRLQEAMQFENA